MISTYTLIVASLLAVVNAEKPTWKIKQAEISEITIGVAFHNDTLGWTSQASGSSYPQIVQTDDGGTTWKKVNTSASFSIVTAIAASKSNIDVQVFGVPFTSEYSNDGNNFHPSSGIPIAGQDVKSCTDGRMIMAGPSGVCVSKNMGKDYTCHRVPLKNEATGRYASSPSENILYYTAGNWPRTNINPQQLTSKLKLLNSDDPSTKDPALTLSPAAQNLHQNLHQNLSIYTAELWKSTNGGKSWTNLISEEGTYYFNDIDCIDDTHCIAIAEGFADDGSLGPGARVYVTTDGTNFELSHLVNKTGYESFMTCQMLSVDEFWIGGTEQLRSPTAQMFMLHSNDGGKSYVNENNNLTGYSVTDIDFISNKHGYATVLDSTQICSLLEYK